MVPKPILLSREQIDAQSWDNHIHNSRQGVIYALSWYLDIICEQWEAFVWPSAADFSITMPLPVKWKWGKRVLYQPLFCQYLGMFSAQELNAGQLDAFLEALKARFSYISHYAFNPENFSVIGRPGPNGFKMEVFQTHWLHLNQSYTELYARYTKDRKVNLKRGSQISWEIVESEDFEPLMALFEKNHARGIGKIKADAYGMLTRLGTECIGRAYGRLMYAQEGAQMRAGVLLTRYRGRTIYLFNAADRAGRRGNARALMLDAYFRENAGTAMIFDFESPPKAPVADYYAGFGAVATPFYVIKRNALPFPFMQMQNLRKWLLPRTRQYLFSVLYRISNPFPANRF
ncbi:hypothetical protein J2Y45_006375 [Dyadobacter sp. BE34]|uniref:BioF2-like acetyltransferase domain-containing protein n=1 Tax=Dyadobacter fermentans TaxID=94254 RepID=A0ABU1R6Y2_9BACT|nr:MULTISPECIES: hypothetical protein [Dyadobacter]MDR6809161.1 hypothetical protein [Dyadobacter fermentans]MDR7046904.1 hypothetical protein [Dyadobacter sp. BE242]MDR7201218.1 hypothetical protein [Dyadobacter sp. BE34]MDR7219178.1 hypothetical protein [Dyadobacter sp. BE31]MDR7264612.1 hypothetical protein [Dyadobacter sp. BE32]